MALAVCMIHIGAIAGKVALVLGETRTVTTALGTMDSMIHGVGIIRTRTIMELVLAVCHRGSTINAAALDMEMVASTGIRGSMGRAQRISSHIVLP